MRPAKRVCQKCNLENINLQFETIGTPRRGNK